MTRSIPEWQGDDDATIPPRVKVRIFTRDGGRCQSCGRKCGIGGESFAFDHKRALINGGKNCETNLQLLCLECHLQKTKSDVAEKVKVYRVRKKFIVRKQSRMPGSRNSPFRKKLNGEVVRR